MPEELESFAGVPGLDTALGLHSVRGRVDSYLRLLRLFIEAHAEDPDAMRRLLDGGRLPELQHFAHALKGTFAILGATRMQALAARIEADVRAQQDQARIIESMAALESEWQVFYKQLAAALAQIAPSGATRFRSPARRAASADAATMSTTLDRIEALLAEDNMAVNGEYRRAADLLRARFGDELKQFEASLQAFDYVAALQWLRLRREAQER
ncbi:MAG: Hpt domain-containing protein [Pseudomonadota bacterium]